MNTTGQGLEFLRPLSSSSSERRLDGSERRPATWWLDAVRREERRGELLTAFDLAERGLEEHPDDEALKHRAVLSLARAGATEEAARRFELFGLGRSADQEIEALRARIAKDVALACEGDERRRSAAAAAELYGAIFARTGAYYPAINAATLWLVAGDPTRASRLADTVLELLAGTPEDSYWAAATEAEARLLLGERTAVAPALERAARLHDRDYAAVATTRRQLRMICEISGIDAQLLTALAGPGVVHFCGHRIGAGERARFSAAAEAAVASRIRETVERDPPGYAYGSLASGADILWAEALLATSAELHVVLPFTQAYFIETSVAPSGADWVERFERCLASSTSVRFASDDGYRGQEVLFRYCSELAMGLALLRARWLDTEARQLAVWDRGPADGSAGTAIDVATWRRRGGTVTLLRPDVAAPTVELIGGMDGDRLDGAPDVDPLAATSDGASPSDPSHPPDADEAHSVRAMLFADIKGFSVLTDEQLLIFAERVLGAFASVLRKHDSDIWHRRTWGDAVFLVLTDAASAASCALDLQNAMASVDLPAEGLPEHLALRLGAHLGPVFRYHDPIIDGPDFTGSHVSRAARVEPVTPPGAVYVTEPFAAALELANRRDLTCDYVGHMPAAKNYGRLRMYRLRHVGSSHS
jgi:hypothetical protein